MSSKTDRTLTLLKRLLVAWVVASAAKRGILITPADLAGFF